MLNDKELRALLWQMCRWAIICATFLGMAVVSNVVSCGGVGALGDPSGPPPVATVGKPLFVDVYPGIGFGPVELPQGYINIQMLEYQKTTSWFLKPGEQVAVSGWVQVTAYSPDDLGGFEEYRGQWQTAGGLAYLRIYVP